MIFGTEHTDALGRLSRLIADFYNDPYARPVRQKFAKVQPLAFDEFRTPLDVIDHVARSLDAGMIHTTHPGYFGYFNPASTFMSVIADALTAVYNPQLGATAHAPAAVDIENSVLQFFLKQLGMAEAGSGGIFTSGGAESNQTALLCALSRKWPEWKTAGISGRRARIYVSSQAHHSLIKAARVAGLGDSAIRAIPTDERQAMRVDALEDALREDERVGYEPFFIVSTYGTTNSGAIDSTHALATLARTHGCWLHVDAAWGGAYAAFVPVLQSQQPFKGADSVSVDAHKALSVSMSAGMLFVFEASELVHTFAVDAEYMPHGANPDYYLRSLQWSRRFIGLKVYMTLAQWSAEGYRTALERHLSLAARLRQGLREDGWSIVTDSPLPIVCFSGSGYSDSELRDIAKNVNRSGSVWLGQTFIDGVAVLRACICNFHTNDADIDRLLCELRAARKSH
jgi:glutamate/tyrosine decarboxylase-like PLP-dependent enzyme